MGRGDKRTRKGKISAGSFGKSRPKKKNVKKTANQAANNDKSDAKESA